MAKTKVLHLITSLNIGGTEEFLLNVLTELNTEYDFSVGYLKQYGTLADEIKNLGIPVTKYNLFSLIRYLRKNKIQLLHTHLYRANIIGRVAGFFARTPVIISSQRSIDRWKKFYHVWLDKISSYCCDLIIANSETAKNILIRREHIPARKIAVVYNGTRIHEAGVETHPAFNNKNPVIGYVGRLHKEKGVLLLPDIIKTVIEVSPKIRFLIVGDGPEKNWLKWEIEHSTSDSSVTFEGWSRVQTYVYHKIDILLLPSEEESFPQAALEAMSLGIPVIASDVGGVSELIEHKKNGILVKNRTAEEFSNAILAMVENQYDYSLYSENSKTKASKFTIPKMIDSINDIYKTLISHIEQ